MKRYSDEVKEILESWKELHERVKFKGMTKHEVFHLGLHDALTCLISIERTRNRKRKKRRKK